MKTGKNSEDAKNLLFEKDERNRTFLHRICSNENWSEKSFKKFFDKLKELKMIISEKEVKELDNDGRNFLHWIEIFNKFEIAFDFLFSEFELDLLRNLLLEGEFFFFLRSKSQ